MYRNDRRGNYRGNNKYTYFHGLLLLSDLNYQLLCINCLYYRKYYVSWGTDVISYFVLFVATSHKQKEENQKDI